MLLLVRSIVNLLRQRLNCTEEELKDYVLNANSPWQIPADDEANGWLTVALNELDAAILGIVDVLDLPAECWPTIWTSA